MLVMAESHCLLPRLIGIVLVTSAIVNLFRWQEAIAHTTKSFPNALVTNMEGYVLGCQSSNLPVAHIRCENCKILANDYVSVETARTIERAGYLLATVDAILRSNHQSPGAFQAYCTGGQYDFAVQPSRFLCWTYATTLTVDGPKNGALYKGIPHLLAV